MISSFSSDFSDLENALGYTFKDKSLLEVALTHPSFAIESPDPSKHYQRLEFLGDAILGHIIVEHLFNLFPYAREGELTKYRSVLVRGSFLANIGNRLGIASFIRMNEAELKAEGQSRISTLEDVMEAIIGAIYLDASFEATKRIVLTWYGDVEKALTELMKQDNPKGNLQERLFQMARQEHTINYCLLKTTGPDHRKEFEVEVFIDDKPYGKGFGSSLRKAEEAAAREALIAIEKKRPRGEDLTN